MGHARCFLRTQAAAAANLSPLPPAPPPVPAGRGGSAPAPESCGSGTAAPLHRSLPPRSPADPRFSVPRSRTGAGGRDSRRYVSARDGEAAAPRRGKHGDKKASGASSKSGEKEADVAEKKPASASVSQPLKTQTSEAPSAIKKQPPAVDASKPQTMKPSETKAAPTTITESGKNTQSTKPTDSQNKQLYEERQKEPNGAKSQTSPSLTTNNAEKVTTAQAGQPPQAISIETAKPKSEKMSTEAAAASAGAAGASVVPVADKSSSEPGMNESALDSLIDTLGGPEEDVPTSPVYTGPEVTEDIASRYLEELGKREGSLPPEYVKLLKSKGGGKDGFPPKADEREEKPMTDDELAEALSSDFTCSTASAEEKTSLTEKPSKEGEIIQAQAVSSVKTSVPPEKKKTKSKEKIKDDVMDVLLGTLDGPEPEPEDHTPVVEVAEAKAKEKKEKKTGELDDTIPPEYRLTAKLDKDGKPVLPKPEEKPEPLSESDLVDEFSKDFACPAQPAVQSKPSKPSSMSKTPSDSVAAKTAEDEAVPCATACTLQSSAATAVPSQVGQVADEALEALSSTLGKMEPDPDEKKPAVDKIKEKTKQEQHKKLGEDEETIPPEYRLTEAKDKEGKPLLPKPEEKSQPMSENDLLEGLSEGFSCSPSVPLPTPTVIKKNKVVKNSAASSDTVSAATVSSVRSAAPLPSASGGKDMDEALDVLSDSLGQREPDPDENKPVVDKVKEKAKSEHRDKLGERDDTIPPDYQELLESGEQGKPIKPTAKGSVKHKEPEKPVDDSAAIDALSGDFDTSARAPATPQHSKDKSGKETTKPTPKAKGKPKDPKTTKGQSSSSKSEKQKTS
ncbi:calpastatin isoform X3 [Lathamus discolor]|uniref:calpastatin isoform X3 n=1 Tax=Lathamus discolor TaxID=678569 RepID=UPI0032B79C11